MKKVVICLVLVSLAVLSGCAGGETMETVADVLPENVPASQPLNLYFEIPEDAAQAADAVEGTKIYEQREGKYTITQSSSLCGIETAVKQLTGYSYAKLVPVKTRQSGMDRYDFVCTAAKDGGLYICRGAVFSDGSRCYSLLMETPEQEAGPLQACMDRVFGKIAFSEDEGF